MRLQLIVCKVMQRDAYYCAARSPNVVDVVVMPQGLHNEPEKLRRKVQKALDVSNDAHGRQKMISAFTKTIEEVTSQVHRTIPPGQHRFQADVETVHDIMESEFYEMESFVEHSDFIQKANAYLLFFNLARKNSGREYKTPWRLVDEKLQNANHHLPLL
jgi:hypothetical protein